MLVLAPDLGRRAGKSLTPCNAEIHHLDDAVAGDIRLLGLEIAMDDPGAVSAATPASACLKMPTHSAAGMRPRRFNSCSRLSPSMNSMTATGAQRG